MASTEQPTSILRPLVEDLAERRAKAELGGGEERIAKQHDKGALTARERLALLYDGGEFTELGIHAGIHYSVRGLEDKEAPPTASSPPSAASTGAWSPAPPTTSR